MATSTTVSATPTAGTASTLTRILREGYGAGAWHGNDLKAALADVSEGTAFWRPGPGRHNIAEIALHHAYCVQSVIARLTGTEARPFVLEGSDWFELPNEKLTWTGVADELATQQDHLAKAVASIASGRRRSPLSEAEQLDLILGVTCHAIYHAGQIQLIKVLEQSS
jgi:DinB family protein